MKKFLLAVMFTAAIQGALAQASSLKASEFDKQIDNECDYQLLLRAEQMPSFTGGNQALVDSMMVRVKANKLKLEDATAEFRMLVTKSSKVAYFSLLGTEEVNKKEKALLMQFMKELFPYWLPGKESGKDACVYVKVFFEFKEEGTKVRIY